jgi:hypothetical protein
MPETDIAVRLRIRFVRNVRGARIWLRVFSCTGQGRKPFEKVYPVGRINAVKGEVVEIPVVDKGISEPGWDAHRPRGWGPQTDGSLLLGSRNIAIIECQGRWLTQRHKFFIASVSHVGRHSSPRIYLQDEQDDIFDTSADAKTGLWRYGE